MDLELMHKYCKIRVNGTIYVTTRLSVTPEREKELEYGAGELYITGIQKECTAEQVMHVATQLGEVYKLRFKIDFSGRSRGFAYLQYIDCHDMKSMVEFLKLRFEQDRIKINVFESKNIKKLMLNNVEHLTPMQVYHKLRQMFRYVKLSVHEFLPRRYVYIILYRNNDDAAKAHHAFRNQIAKFGARACVEWLDKGSTNRSNRELTCCVQLPWWEFLEHQLEANYCCFKI